MKKARIFALLLAGLMLLSFTACGQNSPEAPASDTNDMTNVTDDDTATHTAEHLFDDLPVADYGGYEFRVLQYQESIGTATVLTEMTGNPIEDVIYERMLVVANHLNVKFENHLEGHLESADLLQKCIMAGMDEFDVAWLHSSNTVNQFLSQGYLMDLSQVEGFDFQKPWWDNSANQNLALDDHLYMAFGDVNIYLYDFHVVLLFNKLLTDEHHLDLYTMVDDGSWTIEKFIETTTLALPSPDGNSNNARLGYTGHTINMCGFIHGADVDLFNYDEDGIPFLESVNESYLNVITAYSNLFQDKTICNTDDAYLMDTFAAQKAVFVGNAIGRMSVLREAELDYGLLPFPKRDTAQKEYISYMTNQIQPTVIPKTISDIERAAVILENLSAESYRIVRPEYFHVLLESKYVRDLKSMKNMQMIFECETRFEIEDIYSWGDLGTTVKNALTGEADRFVSAVKKQARLVNRGIEKTLNYLKTGSQ